LKTETIYISEFNPETIRVKIPEKPQDFSLYIYKDGEPYYVRDFGDFDTIDINLKNKGKYTFSVPVQVIYRKNLEAKCPIKLSELPKYERDYPLPENWEKDIQMGRTPARMYAKHGILQTSPNFNNYPLEWRVYILLHELAHSKYKTEWKADTLALYWFCHLGYNYSQALYALSKVLHQSPLNIERINNIYNRIKP
jgi:hypothetical protein